MRRLILTIATVLALAAPAHALTILCNGDSNTQAGGVPVEGRWCERLGPLLNADIINRGVGGSAIVSDIKLYTYGTPLWGDFYIDTEIVDIDPFWFWSHGASTYLSRPTYFPLPKIDIMILAWGTNDINAYHYTPAKILKAIKKARRKLIAHGSQVYVATVPAIYNAETGEKNPDKDKLIQQLNKKIRGNFPKTFIEFYEGFTWADYSDPLHLNAQGQEKRAAAAVQALTR